MSRALGLRLAVTAVVVGLALATVGLASVALAVDAADSAAGLLPGLAVLWAAGHLTGSRTTK